MAYDHIFLEQKWQKFWEDNSTFSTLNPPFDSPKPKKYILDMFPYPSGAGLHVGHPKGYTATDIVSRYYHANGYNVLHPMGFDAFGLPAENYAVKTGTHPAITTAENVGVFTEQLRSLGFSYDWSRMVDTTDPEYYRWTQWIFLKLFEHGLAYEAEMPVNWCPALRAVLANEEVIDGKSEIGGHPVEKKLLRQWVLAITRYADRLLEDLEDLDWPEGIKEMQRNWIGKSEGCEFRMMKKVENSPTVLILHGWGGASISGWKPWIAEKLKLLGYNVIIPDLPNTDEPDVEEQLRFLEKYKEFLREDSIIIGDSMGAFLGSHFITRNNLKLKKFITTGGVYNNLSDIVDWSEQNGGRVAMNSIKKHYDEKKLEQIECMAFISEDDPWIPFQHAKSYYENTGVNVRTFTDKGHFQGQILSELLDEIAEGISVYTTRIDTVYGMTYAVMAPDHPSVDDFITDEYRRECQEYIQTARSKSDIDRTNEGKEKTGVFTGSYAINPYNEEAVPVWIADYVLGSYGTGAVMAVPAHDERDFEFAKKYELSIKTSIYNTNYDEEVVSLLFRPGMKCKIENSSENLSKKYEGKLKIFSIGDNNFRIIAKKIEDLRYFLNTESKTVRVLGYEDMPLNQREGVILGNNPWIFTDDGEVIDLGEYNGLSSAEARKIFTEKAQAEGFGHKKINYKLRDWLFSRQRYWGEPIPLIHIKRSDYENLPREINDRSAYILSHTKVLEDFDVKKISHFNLQDTTSEYLIVDGKVFSKIYDGMNSDKVVCDYSLPLLLPEVEKYEPTGDGQSPLASITEWVNVQLADNLMGKRETNTMPQWGGSCWYYLRYMDNKNREALASREAMDYWGMVDEYVGGAEHAVLHLLYARFWHKFLYDVGVVPTIEPFQKLTNVGLILGPDGNKMSKSRGNVINPNEIVKQHGADTLRLYEMSMGNFTDAAPWNPEAIIGMRRFLDKAYALIGDWPRYASDDMKAMKLLHKSIKKVGEDIVAYKFNTAIAALIILMNEGLPQDPDFQIEWKERFALLLHPFAPHMAEELWQVLGHESSVYMAEWPTYDAFMLVDDEVTIAVQVNGKLRGTFAFFHGVAQEEVSAVVYAEPSIKKWVEGKLLLKEIFVPNKLFSIVVKEDSN